ncbi:MAG TPA: hypothetical protein VF764_04620 [Steroidobacteraceae bacterium]
MADVADVIKQAQDRINPVLHGLPPPVQGLILADLLAMWLAGHFTTDPEETDLLREELLQRHCQSVRELVEINAKILGT